MPGSVDAAVLLDHTVTTSFDVSTTEYPYYLVTVSDAAGNESDPPFVAATTAAEPTTIAETTLLGSSPNPFHLRTTLRLDLARSDRVHLQIYDVGGRLVRTLVDGVQPAGHHRVVWDGRTDLGTPLRPGCTAAAWLRGSTARHFG